MKRLLALKLRRGENRLCALVEDAMRLYLDAYEADPFRAGPGRCRRTAAQ